MTDRMDPYTLQYDEITAQFIAREWFGMSRPTDLPMVTCLTDRGEWAVELTREDVEAWPWIKVEGSSNIERVAWAASVVEPGEENESDDLGSLLVQFSGGRVYHYADVPFGVWSALLVLLDDPSQSVGSYVAQYVRGRFETIRVDVLEG